MDSALHNGLVFFPCTQAKGISIYARETRYNGNRDVPPLLACAEYATRNGRVNLSFRE